jgi:hypothetical protein
MRKVRSISMVGTRDALLDGRDETTRGMTMSKTYNTRPITGEEKWVDFDSDTDCWGIFGLDSGFCYGTYASERDANKALAKEESSK